jgi:hypothetical protein
MTVDFTGRRMTKTKINWDAQKEHPERFGKKQWIV